MRLLNKPDKYVNINGRELWVDIVKNGSPTVVFMPGAGGVGLDFALTHENISNNMTSIIYDRAGTGQCKQAAVEQGRVRQLLKNMKFQFPWQGSEVGRLRPVSERDER